jgi:hypothetical protein
MSRFIEPVTLTGAVGSAPAAGDLAEIATAATDGDPATQWFSMRNHLAFRLSRKAPPG